ncbi:hypothetical protein, partial [Pseudomonas sp. SWRI99]|uniref:hypothetical protein n=1 Tax=Pseudomonas sp. SWRI99 TaxID=2745506 RepID=UPI001EE2BBF8
WLLWAPKVTRRKGGTLSSRYRSNGYVPQTTQNLVGPKAAKVPHKKTTPLTQNFYIFSFMICAADTSSSTERKKPFPIRR